MKHLRLQGHVRSTGKSFQLSVLNVPTSVTDALMALAGDEESSLEDKVLLSKEYCILCGNTKTYRQSTILGQVSPPTQMSYLIASHPMHSSGNVCGSSSQPLLKNKISTACGSVSDPYQRTLP